MCARCDGTHACDCWFSCAVMLVYGLGGVEGALEVNPAVLFVGNGATDRRNHREANFSCIEVCPGECFLTLIQVCTVCPS